MLYPGFTGPTYPLAYKKAACERAVNCFNEIIESGNGPDGAVKVLRSIYGLKLATTLGTGPIRGIYTASTGVVFVASGNKVYMVTASYTYASIGTIGTYYGPVSFADNGTQLMIVDGESGWIYTLISGDFTEITNENFTKADVVIFQDGYFLVNNSGTGQFAISALYDGLSWNGLDYGTAEGNPDNLISIISYRHLVWLFGAKTIEVYWNSGNSDFPFSRVDGAYSEVGCAGPHAIAKVGTSMMWVTDKGNVAVANGYEPVRISSHAVEQAINKTADLSSIQAYSYTQDGHYFFCLQMSDASSQWVYDLATKEWHERCDLVDGQFDRFRGVWYTNATQDVICGDKDNGNIYILDKDTNDLNGDVLVRERTASHLINEMRRVFIDRFEVLIETGVGTSLGQGQNPQMMLSISVDGGYTWGPERWKPIGKIGAFKSRAIWRMCGSGRDLVYKIRMTDPVPFAVTGASLDLRMGVS